MSRPPKSDAEFFATVTAVVNDLEKQIQWVGPGERSGWRALEIGCGAGRLLRPLSRHFRELHGVEIAEDLLSRAREITRDLPQVRLHSSQGAALAGLADNTFDYVYSHDFLPRLENRPLVLDFLRETHRVLRVGGLARIELSGTHFTSLDVLDFAQTQGFQTLALQGAATPSLWTTWRKQSVGRLESGDEFQRVTIRRITNASSFEPVAPCRGRFASIILCVENLPLRAGIQHLRVTIGNALGTVTEIGAPDRTGLQSIHVNLPELEATGLLPVQVLWRERPLSEPVTLRVIPPGPVIPRVVATPGHTVSREVSLTLEEVARPWEMEVFVDGGPIEDVEKICVDPRAQRYAVNLRLPADLAPGPHTITINVGRRKLAPVPIDVSLRVQ